MQNLILNRYRPLEEAGAGGFATVLAAWDTRIQRRVAIKCLRLDGYASPADARSPREIPGLDEARTAAMLSDSHIVGVYDFDASGAQAYLIMEYMDGITLTELMREEGALSLDVATCVFEAVAGALETAHENQVLHLDIKPDNVLINRQGQVKVADFGLSQLSHAAGYGRAAGGTIGYMPLEQMRLEACDARTDEWALAALAYEMLVGENPFRVPGLDAAERAIEQAEVFVPSMVRDDLNEEVDEALFGALAIDRDDRFDSVELFADAMLPHMGDARRGARELAVLVGEACDDGADFDEEGGMASAFLPGRGAACAGLSVFDRMAPRTKALVARLWAAAVCGFAAFEAAVNIPVCMTIAGRMEPAFWGVVGVAVTAALVWPGAGAAFAVGALVVALALSGSPFLALALALAGVAWLAFGGARWHVCANVGATAVLAGAFGFAPVVPLLAGYFLNVKHAFAATAFAVVSAFCLACAGSLDLTGWNAFVFGSMPGMNAMEDAALSLVASPSMWAMAVSWLVAAVVGSLLCARGNRGLAACGMLAATAILVLGVIAAARRGRAAVPARGPRAPPLGCGVGHGSAKAARGSVGRVVRAAAGVGGAPFPDVAQLAPALVAGVAMACATAAGLPQRPARIE